VTSALIAINVVVFVWVLFGGGVSSFGDNARTLKLAIGRDLLDDPDGWYRIVSSGFTHYGALHLALNMYSVYLLGGALERRLGSARFALLYLASLLGGSAGAVWLQPEARHAGASGAVFGMMAALAVSLWRQGVNPLNTSIGQVLMINVGITVLGASYISVGGHLGGAVAGAACAWVMLAPQWRPFPQWATVSTPVAVGFVSIALCIVAGQNPPM
jgi:membrane associated rhomboid family serine protease